MADIKSILPREISYDIISERIHAAISLLIKNDSFLLKNKIHERTIAHKLGEYLQLNFIEWNVDCEYNKHGLDKKILIRDCSGSIKHRVYPDIIIHERGNDNHNLVVIEIKPYKQMKVNCCDNLKLELFTDPNGKYRYNFGIFIGFNGIKKPQIEFYPKGKT